MNNKTIMFKNILYNITDNGDIGNGWKYIEVINKKQEFSLPKCLYYKGKSMKDLLSYTEYVNHLDIGKDFINDFVKDIFRDCYPGSKNPICKVKENLMVGGGKITNKQFKMILDVLETDEYKKNTSDENIKKIYEKTMNVPGKQAMKKKKQTAIISFIKEGKFNIEEYDGYGVDKLNKELIERLEEGNKKLKTQNEAKSDDIKLEEKKNEEVDTKVQGIDEGGKTQEGKNQDKDENTTKLEKQDGDEGNEEGDKEGNEEEKTTGSEVNTEEAPKEVLTNVNAFFKDKNRLPTKEEIEKLRDENKKHFTDKTETEIATIMNKILEKKIKEKSSAISEELEKERKNTEEKGDEEGDEEGNEGQKTKKLEEGGEAITEDDKNKEKEKTTEEEDTVISSQGGEDDDETSVVVTEEGNEGQKTKLEEEKEEGGEATTEEEDTMTLQLKKLNDKFKYHNKSKPTWDLETKFKESPVGIYYFNLNDNTEQILFYGAYKADDSNTSVAEGDRLEIIKNGIVNNVYLSTGEEPFVYRKLIYIGEEPDNSKSNIENIIHYLIARDLVKDDNEKKELMKLPKYKNSMKKFESIYKNRTLDRPSTN